MDTKDLTKGLQNFLRQLNAAFPDRPTGSDGTLGDPAHATRLSGHNLDDVKNSKAEWNGDNDNIPEIRAIDITNFEYAPAIVHHLIALPHVDTVIRYIIFERRIYHAPLFLSSVYNGDDPHTNHFHVSGAWTNASDANPTFNYQFGDIPVALTDADIEKVAKAVLNIEIGDKAHPTRTVGDVLRDAAKLRGYLVGDAKDIENADIVNGAPIAQMIDAADEYLSNEPIPDVNA